MQKVKIFILIAVLGLSFWGCEKVEGPGGSASITGTVTVRHYTATYAGVAPNPDTLFSLQVTTYPAYEEDVYIIYGAETDYHDDDTKVFVDGTFRFDFLEVGDYNIYVYDRCPFNFETGNNTQVNCDQVPIIIPVHISEKGETVDVGDIEITKITKL